MPQDTPSTAPRRDAAATRARILAAAQKVFSTLGYAGAGIREIAAEAGTSTTLMIRYYGSKAGLFEAALTKALTADQVWNHPRAQIGRYLADQFLRADVRIVPPAMIALAAGDAEAAAIAARVVQTHAIAPMAHWLGGPDAQARASRVFMLATSFVLYSRQVPVAPLGGTVATSLADWVAAEIQAVVDDASGDGARQMV